MMKEPIEPNIDDCCNSGCNPCIFDIYEQQLRNYKKYLETGETSSLNDLENALSQLEYTNFSLVQIVAICELHILLGFIGKQKEKKVWWKAGEHLLLKYNSDDLSCTRAYTPLKLKDTGVDCDFYIIVKIYENGLVSNYLHRLKLGEETLWRGPYGSFEYKPNTFMRIVMIAQGTGIAPFISIINDILDNNDDMTRIILYFCVKNQDCILLRDELYTYKEYWNFSYKVFLSNSDFVKFKYEEPLVCHKLCLEDLLVLNPISPTSDQFLICGSTEFMENIKVLLKNQDTSLENIVARLLYRVGELEG